MTKGYGYCVYRHFQQYSSYIVTFSFIGGGKQSTRRKPLTCSSHRQTLSNNVVSSGIRTHNVSGDSH